MDIYSLGILLWEIWHEAVPFDNELDQAIKYVVKEDSRPKIIQSVEDLDLDKDDDQDTSKLTFCDDIISTLIRKCWNADPNNRPVLFEIC